MSTTEAPVQSEHSAWLAQRQQGVGASESAALFGIHPYISMLSLYESKIAEPKLDDEGNERMEDGKVIEPRIAARYAKATGRAVYAPTSKIYIHVNNPRMICSPDKIVVFNNDCAPDQPGHRCRKCAGPLELKWWDNYRADDEIPEYGQIQVQHQIGVLGSDKGSIAILGSFRSFHYKDVERHDPFIELLHEKINAFWWHVDNRVPPTADGSDATAAALKRLYPKDTGVTIFLPAESSTWAADLAQAKADIKDAEARESLAKNQLAAAIGDATFGRLPDGTAFSYKQQKRAAHVVAESEFRVLRKVK